MEGERREKVRLSAKENAKAVPVVGRYRLANVVPGQRGMLREDVGNGL